jgi:hypothetical protein
MNREPSLPDAFEITGSFRDIAVLGTESLEDWREFLKFVTGSFRTEFLVDLEPRHAPEDPALIFEQRDSTPVLLRVFLGGIQLNCHFFGGDIELDLDPLRRSGSRTTSIASSASSRSLEMCSSRNAARAVTRGLGRRRGGTGGCGGSASPGLVLTSRAPGAGRPRRAPGCPCRAWV